MNLLAPFNVTPATATKIYEHFGAKSVEILQNNPFELCQISGFGFKQVDTIVRKGDCKLNDPMRIHGAIYAALDTERNENGHLYLELEALLKESNRLLNDRLASDQVRVTNEPFVADHGIKCDYCDDMVVCQDCCLTVPKRQARYIENAYHCNACMHVCGCCGQAVRDTMYPAYDRRGRLIEVCQQCYSPCFKY